MAKWVFTRAGTWDYPTLGFTATTDDIIEADLAPDAWWDETDSGATPTIPVVPSGGVEEPASDSLLVYNAVTNRGEWTPLTDLGLDEASLSSTFATLQRATAKAVLAAVPPVMDAVRLSPVAAGTTVTNGADATPTIASGVRYAPTRLTAALIDNAHDPHFAYLGVPDGKLIVQAGDCAEGAYLAGQTSGGQRWRAVLATEHTGQAIEFYFRAASGGDFIYMIWVDGQPLWLAPQTFADATSGARYLIKADFGSVATRSLRFYINAQYGGAYVGPTDTLRRPANHRPRLVTLGDSITQGASVTLGGATPLNAWPSVAGQLLGMDVCNIAIGGTGFIAAGSNGVSPYTVRLTDLAAAEGDVIVVAGGYNDAATSTHEQIQAAAETVIGQAVAQNPRAVVVAVGSWQATDSDSPTLLAADNAVRDAAAAVGVPFISTQDPTGHRDTAAAWVTGTTYQVGDSVLHNGYVWKCVTYHTSGASIDVSKFRSTPFITGTGKVGTTTGLGNGDVFITSDGVHPTVAGHAALGYHLASQIMGALRTVSAP